MLVQHKIQYNLLRDWYESVDKEYGDKGNGS